MRPEKETVMLRPQNISEIVAIRKHEQNIVFNQDTTYNGEQNTVGIKSVNILSNSQLQ